MYSYFPCQVTFWTVSIKISLNRIYYNFKQVFDSHPKFGTKLVVVTQSHQLPCGRESPWPPSTHVVTPALPYPVLSKILQKVQASWSYSLILLLTAVTIRDALLAESEHFPVNKLSNSEAIWLRKLFWSEMCAFLGSGIWERPWQYWIQGNYNLGRISERTDW